MPQPQPLRRLAFPLVLLTLLGASSCIVPVGHRRGYRAPGPACRRGPVITLGQVVLEAPRMDLRI